MKKIRKKGQFKIQEMAFVLLAVVLLFGLVFLFFARFQLGQVQDVATKTREERAITLVRAVASMPELRCSKSITRIGESSCLDLDKVVAFHENENIRMNYKKMWRSSFVSKIAVQEVYPPGETYWIYKEEVENERGYAGFIPLCSEDNCVIARLLVSVKTGNSE